MKNQLCAFCAAKGKMEIHEAEGCFCNQSCFQNYKAVKKGAPLAGEHLITFRKGYCHHGIGDSEGGIIHYSGMAENIGSGPVCRTNLERFSNGYNVMIVWHKKRKYSVAESIKRAESRIGEANYHLGGNNCEHFVNWCIEPISKVLNIENGGLYSV